MLRLPDFQMPPSLPGHRCVCGFILCMHWLSITVLESSPDLENKCRRVMLINAWDGQDREGREIHVHELNNKA